MFCSKCNENNRNINMICNGGSCRHDGNVNMICDECVEIMKQNSKMIICNECIEDLHEYYNKKLH